MIKMFSTTRRCVGVFSVLAKPTIYNVNRCKSSSYDMGRRSALKQDSGEFIKWLLLVIPVSSFGLGVWQTFRLQWKLGLIEDLKRKTNAEPVELPEDLSQLENMEYKPVKVKGKFLHDKEIFIGPRSLIDEAHVGRASLLSDPKSNQGALVITPFKLASGETILLNRGWIPQNMKQKSQRIPSLVENEVELVGVVRLTQKREPFMPKNQPGAWYYRDIDGISEYMGALPVWLDVRGIPDPPPGWPVPNQTRVTLRNEHMSYLVTWYSLSVVTAIMWHRFFIKKLPLL